jgi:UrcA family protein
MSLRNLALVTAACAVATLSLATATPAGATDIVVAPETVTVRVSYADLNLATVEGRARLDRRIASAARSICGSPFQNDLHMSALVSECRDDAIASARIPTQVASNDRAVVMTGHRMSRAAN